MLIVVGVIEVAVTFGGGIEGTTNKHYIQNLCARLETQYITLKIYFTNIKTDLSFLIICMVMDSIVKISVVLVLWN